MQAGTVIVDYDLAFGTAGLDFNQDPIQGIADALLKPDRLDPVLLDFRDGRAAQKAKYGGELFPAELPEGLSGRTFLEFFQTDRDTGGPKGIVSIDLNAQDFGR